MLLFDCSTTLGTKDRPLEFKRRMDQSVESVRTVADMAGDVTISEQPVYTADALTNQVCRRVQGVSISSFYT